MTIRLDRAARQAHVDVNGTQLALVPGRLTDWITLTFRAAQVSGHRASAGCS